MVKDIQKNAPGFDYVIINDRSTDNTLDVCKENGLNDNEINMIKIKLQLLGIDLNGKIYK